MAVMALLDIVERQGSAALTARAVAEAIGYTVGTLYLAFRNLDDLILHGNARTLVELGAHMKRAAARAGTTQARVRAMGRAYIRFAQLHPERWQLIFEHRLPDGTDIPDFYQAHITALFTQVESALSPLLPDAAPVQLARAARALWGGVHGVCILGITGKLSVTGQVTVASLADTLIENYLLGLAQSRAGRKR